MRKLTRIAILAGFSLASAITSVHAMVVKTASAIDGDTLKLNSKTKIRLLELKTSDDYAEHNRATRPLWVNKDFPQGDRQHVFTA